MTQPQSLPLESMQRAIDAAASFIGATDPNPPVGAAAWDKDGALLAVEAHARAGEPHAEALVLKQLRALGLLSRLHGLAVTLEPCNHTGRTGPCTEALLKARKEGAPLKEIWIGARDPNPTAQGGAERLRAEGLIVHEIDRSFKHTLSSPGTSLQDSLWRLNAPFFKWVRTQTPWVVIKQAINSQGSMIPPPGQKTFSSPEQLDLAHRIRRQSRAILTGSGTILADLPEFTVRRVADHEPQPDRILWVMDRRKRVSSAELDRFRASGFEILLETDIASGLKTLGQKGCLQLLVEAGPTLTQSILNGGFWDENVVIQPERVTHVYRNR